MEKRKQTFKHLRPLLKPLPLDVPVTIELSPGCKIQVTLLDANHCIGAVMFLIEDGKKAILYTGDIRAEMWWVESLCRHPSLVAYTSAAAFRRLDAVYLDTTFAVPKSPYQDFPAKAVGLTQLLTKLSKYPLDTFFYFHNWTFGYEDVLIAVSKMLQSPIHLDDYRYKIYRSLSRNCGPGLECRGAASLCGFQIGNTAQPGIFTSNAQVRLHSCEKGLDCEVLAVENIGKVVHIIPIVSRHQNEDIEELGAGGGKGDLTQVHALDLSDQNAVAQFRRLCDESIEDKAAKASISEMLERILATDQRSVPLEQVREASFDPSSIFEEDVIPLSSAITIISRLVTAKSALSIPESSKRDSEDVLLQKVPILPLQIKFPYSRHSSFNELRYLINALKPSDIIPCTEPTLKDFTEEHSMQALFGDLYETDSPCFRWDEMMRAHLRQMSKTSEDRSSQATTEADLEELGCPDMQEDNETRPVQRARSPRPVREAGQKLARDESNNDVQGKYPADKDPSLPGLSDESRSRMRQVSSQDGSQVQPYVIEEDHDLQFRLRKRKLAVEASTRGKWNGLILMSTKSHRRSSDSSEL